MSSIFKTIAERLKEPSTYAGLTGLLVTFGIFGLSQSEWNVVLGGLGGLFSALAVLLAERGPKE